MKSALAAVVLIGLTATPALAHGTFAPGQGFIAGVQHPVFAFAHLIALLGLGILLGRQQPKSVTWPLAGLAVSLGLVLLTGPLLHQPASTLVLALVAGLLIAWARPVPVAILTVLAIAIGVAVGSDTDLTLTEGAKRAEVIGAGLGVFAGVFLIVLNSLAFARVATHPVAAIGVRVAGSWIAAASLMVLALLLRPVFVGA